MAVSVADVSPFLKASGEELEKVLRLLATPASGRPALFARADALRQECMGDEVYLRGIVEFSNICANKCTYCGIRLPNERVERYRIPDDEILEVARQMEGWQQGTIVLQSGEANSVKNNRAIGALIARIKKETNLSVTLSAGNRSADVYRHWRECGMDRYLLRFESCNPELFARIHPDCDLGERIDCLHSLRDLGVQVGSGFMIGLPGETPEILAGNILLCRDLDLDMIGIGPFIPHPETPMATDANVHAGDKDMFFVAVAVLRLLNPDAHIPATTAFDAIFPNHEGRNRTLQCGANVFMPNVTPVKYRRHYLLYPDKPCVDEPASLCSICIPGRLAMLGRPVGKGPGHSRKKRSESQ